MNKILQESSFVEGIVNSVVKDRRKEKLMENKVKKMESKGHILFKCIFSSFGCRKIPRNKLLVNSVVKKEKKN